jgi:hypothetical protein
MTCPPNPSGACAAVDPPSHATESGGCDGCGRPCAGRPPPSKQRRTFSAATTRASSSSMRAVSVRRRASSLARQAALSASFAATSRDSARVNSRSSAAYSCGRSHSTQCRAARCETPRSRRHDKLPWGKTLHGTALRSTAQCYTALHCAKLQGPRAQTRRALARNRACGANQGTNHPPPHPTTPVPYQVRPVVALQLQEIHTGGGLLGVLAEQDLELQLRAAVRGREGESRGGCAHGLLRQMHARAQPAPPHTSRRARAALMLSFSAATDAYLTAASAAQQKKHVPERRRNW